MPGRAARLLARTAGAGPLRTRAQPLWAAYWDYQARRATALMLESLDDRMLKDIGLRRSQIWPFVLGTPGDRQRPYHPSWRSRPAAPQGSKLGISRICGEPWEG